MIFLRLREHGPRVPSVKNMSQALYRVYRKEIRERSLANRAIRLGLPSPEERRALRRKGTNAKREAKACRHVPGIEHLALDPCAYCGDPVATTHDHVEPISRGGLHALDNLVRACWRCNREKNTQPLLVFLARRALRRCEAA